MSNIVLIGFMGTGKSTIGRKLAMKLGYKFADSDKLIVETAGMTINQIFEKHGEAYFRELEKQIVAVLSKSKNHVISTGGGVVLDPENISVLSKNASIVCLKAKPEVILKRVANEKYRPLLNVENPAKAIAEKLKSREGLYNGDLVIDTSDMSIEDTVNRILSFINAKSIFHEIPVSLGVDSYRIMTGTKFLKQIDNILDGTLDAKKIMLVTNPTVYNLWGKNVENYIKNESRQIIWSIIPDGEEFKTMNTVMNIIDTAVENKLDRKSAIIALGGGVVGDMAGFAAAIYMRGIPLIQIPTTLLAQVDSSIGGKTAVNHSRGKNLIGSFYQPKLVFSDCSMLTTLPQVELVNGLAEVIKHGAILDACLFDYLENNIEKILNFNQEAISRIVADCCRIKASIVEKDEKETGIRGLLNYGHTVAHGIESATNYKVYKHGEAVAIGMDIAAKISVMKDTLSMGEYYKQRSLLERAGLPVDFPKINRDAFMEAFLEAVTSDKKIKNGKLEYILLNSIGCAYIDKTVTLDDIVEAIDIKF